MLSVKKRIAMRNQRRKKKLKKSNKRSLRRSKKVLMRKIAMQKIINFKLK